MDQLLYGPDGPRESDLRLLGDVKGKRIVDLGCGTGANSVLLARSGAVVTGIDPSADNLAATRRLAEKAGVKLETRQADPGSMAFLASNSVDAVLSIYSLGHADVQRVFRQVQRVLRPGGPLVLSVAHPSKLMLDSMLEDGAPSYFGDSGYGDSGYGDSGYGDSGYSGNDIRVRSGRARRTAESNQRHTIESLFAALSRSGYRVDTLLEPEPLRGEAQPGPAVPHTLIVRGRKLGG